MPATKTRPTSTKTSGKAKPRRRYNWPKVEALYVEGVEEEGELVYPSLRMVAQILDLEPVRVREKCAQDGWVQKRAAHQAELARTRQDVRRRRVAETAVDLDLRALATSRAGVELVSRRIGHALDVEASGSVPKDGQNGDRISSAELASLAVSLRRFHHVGLAALGERPVTHPDDETAEAYLEAGLDAAHARLLEGFRSFRERIEAGDAAGAIEAAAVEDVVEVDEVRP